MKLNIGDRVYRAHMPERLHGVVQLELVTQQEPGAIIPITNRLIVLRDDGVREVTAGWYLQSLLEEGLLR